MRVNGFAASHTHVLSSTLVNEARFGLSREHTNRLQPGGDDTSDLPGKFGILGIPQVNGNGGLPSIRPGTLNGAGIGVQVRGGFGRVTRQSPVAGTRLGADPVATLWAGGRGG